MRRPAEGARVAAVTVAALVGIASATWGAVNTPLFHAHDVRVQGNHRLSSDAVLTMAGIAATTNVVRMSPGGIERRLEANPWVADARVGRDLPDSISITIEERSPVATVRIAGRWATLAADAVVLATGRERPSLPVLDLRIGGPLPAPGVRLARAAAVVSVIASVPRRLAIVGAREDAQEVELELASGVRILYGSGVERSQKNASILALLSWARGEGRAVRLIDVRVPQAPALRLGAQVSPA